MAPLLILLAKPFLWPWDVSAIYWMDCSEISSARFSDEVSSRDHRSKRLAPGGKFADARLPGSQISQSIHPTDAVRSRRQSIQE